MPPLTDKAASFARTETEEGTVGDVPEMVERVARALLAVSSNPKLGETMEAMDDDELEFLLAHARAAIAAIREPTARMVAEGESAASFGIGKPNDEDALPRVWFAMIDVALGNPPVAR